MNNLKIITQYSPWFIVLCLLAGAGYAFLLYTKKYSWSKNTNIFLSVLRFFLVSILCFLLLGPYIKQLKNNFENPSVVIAIDNSQSVRYSEDTARLTALKNNVSSLIDQLQGKKAEVEIRTLEKTFTSDQVKEISFSYPSSNLSKMLADIESDYANRNLAGIVLISDGIYNQGTAPNFQQYKEPLYTVGLGDTIPKKDINLKSLLYNKISYTGNKFPIVAEIHNSGFKGQTIAVLLKHKNKIIARQNVPITSDKGISEAKFEISSEAPGLQHYVVESSFLDGEFTRDNNIGHAYIEIIDGKEKILIVASSPHPDIKALKNAIEKKENYDVQVYIPGINELKQGKFDLVIFHQLPDFFNTAKDLKEKFIKSETSLLFIAAAQTSVNGFNNENKLLRISGNFTQTDQVTPVFNPAFEKFKFDPEDQKILDKYPPVTVPFGNYMLSEDAEVILYQRVGMINTQKPLFSISNKTKKTGVLVGEGIWGWPLHEFEQTKETRTFDKLIGNIVQYLSSKEDKRKFRVYPLENEFSIAEPVLFNIEIYNDIYEKIYGQKIDLKIADENGNINSYSFENGENATRFEVKGLKQGIYKYTATSTILGKPERSQGEFSIKELNLESVSTTADHELLRLLSSRTGGKFVLPQQLSGLSDIMGSTKLNSIIHTSEEFDEVIHLPWIGIFLLTLASLEWFLRKFKGGY